MKVHQANGSNKLHVIWSMKYCIKAGGSLYPIICKLSQGSNILSDCKSNIVIQSESGNIIIDCQIKTCDGWLAEVEFLQDIGPERAQLAMSSVQRNIMHVKLCHPSKVITLATGRAMDLHLSGTFNPCESCAL